MKSPNLWSLYYRLREARQGIARNTWASLATIVLLTLTLLLFGGFVWLNANLSQVAEMLERQVQVRVFADEGTAAESLPALLENVPGVRRVELVDGEAVYAQLAPVFGQEALMRALPTDAFADSLSVELINPEQGADVVARIRTVDGVGDVIWGKGFANKLYQVSNGLQKGGVILIVGFFIAAFLMSLTSDVVVASPRFPGGSGIEGAVLVYLGGDDGPAAVPSWSNVTEIVSVTMAPAVMKVQVPVQEPEMSMPTGVGVFGEPPHDRPPARVAEHRIATRDRRRKVNG